MTDIEFRIVIGFLLAVVVLLFVACLVLCLCYLVIARRLTTQMRKTVRRMESLLDETIASRKFFDVDCVPPMRISVRQIAHCEIPLQEPKLLDRVDTRLRELSFSAAGDYRVDETDEFLRAYVSEDRLMLAAIRLPANEQLYAEFFMDIGDGRLAGVGNPPSGCIMPDDTSIAKHFPGSLEDNPVLLSQMWLEAKDMIDTLECSQIESDGVAGFFEHAHAAEMQWRMQHGGITEQEVRAAFVSQGVNASSEDIETVQLCWQRAIDRYILESAFVDGFPPSGSASRLLVVHDYSLAAHLEDRLAAFGERISNDTTVKSAAAASSIESCRGLLATMLKLFPAREAIARLRPHLPDNCRYQLLSSIKQPVAADIYLFPGASIAAPI